MHERYHTNDIIARAGQGPLMPPFCHSGCNPGTAYSCGVKCAAASGTMSRNAECTSSFGVHEPPSCFWGQPSIQCNGAPSHRWRAFPNHNTPFTVCTRMKGKRETIAKAKEWIGRTESEHGWIVSEKRHFGSGDYKFEGKDIAAMRKEFEELQERCAAMKGKVQPSVSTRGSTRGSTRESTRGRPGEGQEKARICITMGAPEMICIYKPPIYIYILCT